MSKSRRNVLTDPLLNKSHPHKEKELMPQACRDCGGTGFIPWDSEDPIQTGEAEDSFCETCGGEGVEYLPE